MIIGLFLYRSNEFSTTKKEVEISWSLETGEEIRNARPDAAESVGKWLDQICGKVKSRVVTRSKSNLR